MTTTVKNKRESTRTPKQQQTLLIVAAVTAVAVLVAVIAIFLSSRDITTASGFDYASIPHSRTADGGFVLGDPDAPITIVEFADFLCPACQAYQPTMDRFVREYVATGQAKFEYRFFPTQGQLSVYTAQVAECADEQQEGGFWAAHDELFAIANNRRIDNNIGREIADRMGLNYSQLLQCVRDANQVFTDQRLGGTANVQGTPAIRVRYGDSAPQILGNADRGGVTFEALSAAVIAANMTGR